MTRKVQPATLRVFAAAYNADVIALQHDLRTMQRDDVSFPAGMQALSLKLTDAEYLKFHRSLNWG